MSRIGRAPIAVPSTVKVRQEDHRLHVEGPKGALSITLPQMISVRMVGERLQVEAAGEGASVKAFHGLARALIANMVHGVTSGFSKELEVVGVGYRAQVQGRQLSLHVGFSHPVLLPVPEGVTVEAPKPTSLVVKGADKQLVGQFAATIRRIAPPEPYKGKGIKYVGELIRRKAGKAATGSGAKAAG
ncbi:MAG: 50S ribosomal protein L6 [Candidatus Omnitrophota bacterium]|nr:50S ribosomal protein L6 [Candidatus Omnitrophota bacterium]